MPSLCSDLVGNDDHWVQPNLDHAALLAVIGNAANTDFADSRLALTNLSTRAPTVIAFTLAAEPDCICCGHSPTVCPADVANATPFEQQDDCLYKWEMTSTLLSPSSSTMMPLAVQLEPPTTTWPTSLEPMDTAMPPIPWCV